MPANAPTPETFDRDPRVHIDKITGKYQYEDTDTGTEFEWTGSTWIPLVDDSLIKAQQQAYSVEGVDENTPAAPVLAREDRIKKRKAGEKEQAPKPSKTSNQAGPKNTAVWVSNLPPDTTLEQLAGVFSKAGVLLIGDDGEPRIKLYYDENGKFKGEALIMYFKEGSVDLAITLLDDTELEFGAGCGNMRVREAEYQHSKSNHSKKSEGRPDQPLQPTDRKKLSTEEKQRMSKRMRTLEDKLAWHSDEDSDAVESSAKSQGKPSPFNRVVVLKGMFRPEDLEKEPELLLELKDDVREEAESLGSVTSVVLYDKEPEGVITIKFKDPTAARACLLKMDGRYFDGRKITAALFTGKERYRRSGGRTGEDDGLEENQRLDNFADWLLKDGDGA